MNIAILIDAENVLPAHADLIFSHAQKLGTVVSKEIFGAASALSAWVAPVLKYALHPNLTIKAAKGKNSSDIALVIGAMDLLVVGGIDCAIIASSDSDFSALSVRLRNSGIEVVGMGTDKSNDLWRTACSSFVVLQNQKSAQPAKQAQPPKQAQPQKQEPAAQSANPAASSTHKQRVAVIGEAILKRLRSSGGRTQVSTLFPMLNKLPEYKQDRQGSGKRPLNYLTSTYGSTFRFEETSDGKNWVSLPDAQVSEAKETVVQAVEADAENEPAPAPTDEAKSGPNAKETRDAREAQDAPQERKADAPEAAAPEAEGEAQASEGEGYVTPQEIVRRLVAGGFDESVASQVTDIFADSTSYRAAYNRLRSVFGSTAGRDYYQRAKEILTAPAK